MEGHDTLWTQKTGKLSQHRHRIRLKLQNLPTNHSVERSVERHHGGISLTE
jgi:hypothetical protein